MDAGIMILYVTMGHEHLLYTLLGIEGAECKTHGHMVIQWNHHHYMHARLGLL